jgi:protein Mpv17
LGKNGKSTHNRRVGCGTGVQMVLVVEQLVQLQLESAVIDDKGKHIPSHAPTLYAVTNTHVQVTVNQLLFTPFFNSYFFGMQSFLSGATLPEVAERIKNTVPISWINSCKIWPAVTAFMFAFIPLEYRSIFGGVIAIGWQTYLSLLNQRAAAVEELGHATDAGNVESKPAPARVREVQRESTREKCAA